MAIATDIFKSTSTGAEYVDPEIWDKQIEQVARQKNVMLQLGVENTTLLGKPGKQINIAKNHAFVASDLTEGVQTPVSAIDFDQVTITVKEVGLAKQVSQLQLDYEFETVINDVIRNMGLAVAEKLDADIISECVSGAGHSVYPNGHDSSSVDAGDVLDYDTLLSARKALRSSNRTPLYLVINPDQEMELYQIKDPAGRYIFVDSSISGNRELLNGQIGTILGMKVFVSTRIPSATENTSVTVYKALMLGERPFAVAWKRKPQLKYKEDSILDRAVTFTVTATYGVKVLNPESIVVITTA